MLYNYLILFFFFQAEDGIRDVAVTGVQTCALPISPLAPFLCVCSSEPFRLALQSPRRSGSRARREGEGDRDDYGNLYAAAEVGGVHGGGPRRLARAAGQHDLRDSPLD